MRFVLVAALLTCSTLAAAEAPKAKAKPKPRAPSALVLVIDRSGSMQGPKLEAAKTAAIASVKTLHAADQFAVITFDTEIKVVVARQGAAKNRKQVVTDLQAINAGGGTNIYPGLAEAYVTLRGLKGTKHVILLSDGEAPRDGLSELLGDMRRDDITVSTVAVDGADEKLLRDISDQGGGRMYKVTNLGKLSQVYVDEIHVAFR